MGQHDRLELTEDEAYLLLALCLTSEMQLDAQSETVLNKLAQFCRNHKFATNSNHSALKGLELSEAG